MNKFTLRAKIYLILAVIVVLPGILVDCEESFSLCAFRPFLFLISIVLVLLTLVILFGKKSKDEIDNIGNE